MSNNYGFLLDDYVDKPDRCAKLMSQFLNEGYAGLLLGGGVSKALGLPSWSKLVLDIAEEKFPGEYDLTKDYPTNELKAITDRVRTACKDLPTYYELTKKHLYAAVTFDFRSLDKDLLIALSSLIIGKKRGNVSNVVTLNFDSVLEWYLTVNGMDVNVLSKDQLFHRSADVNITHIHGFLPYHPDLGKNSDFLIFSQEEFEDRFMSENDYWKDYYTEFFRGHVFLAVGINPDSLDSDIIPYLRQLDKWYERETPRGRLMPYGIALLTPGAKPEQIAKFIRSGIIPCTLDKSLIPPTIFNIAQYASPKSILI